MSLNWYKILCFGRIALTLLPQTGYIHPDEHFQCPEVVYGDTLQLQVQKTWEFTTEKPIRTIVFPYLITGLPSMVEKLLRFDYLRGTFLFPYLMLTMPRMIMCGLSFLNDLLIYKLCIVMGKNPTLSLIMFASSYTTIIYLTRTFSNCLEVLFFSLTIYLLCRLLHSKNDAINSSYPNLTYTSFMLGMTVAMGIYNRPSFIFFAAFPVPLFLLLTTEEKMNNLVSFLLGSLCTSLVLTSIDTLYYNQTHYGSVYKLYQNIIITPLNFIRYNADKNNLQSHGLHSCWLHICVNIPLLFSIYGVFVMLDFVRWTIQSLRKSRLSVKSVLLLSFVVPLFLLSLVPHQEPRFLLPLIFPLSILHRDLFSHKFVNRKICTRLWYINNVLGVLFFGFFHQAGVYTSLSYIHTTMKSSCDIIYYKTYMPPRYLLGISESEEDVRVYDFAGVDLHTFEASIRNITLQSKAETVYVVVPQAALNFVLNLPVYQLHYQYFKMREIFPHLSVEDLPKSSEMVDVAIDSEMSVWLKMCELKKMLSIYVLIFKSKI